MKQSSRIIWADLLRVIAIFCVVLLHSASPLIYQWNTISTTWWQISNIYDSFCRIAVPLLLLLSGTLLLGKSENFNFYLKNRLFKRVLIPFISWVFIYLVYLKVKTPGFSISAAMDLVLKGNVYYHLAFFNYFIGLYLVIPIFRPLVQSRKDKELWYFILLWLIFSSILPFLNKIMNIQVGLSLREVTGFVGYIILGHVLKEITLKSTKLYVCIGVFIISSLLTAFGTYKLTSVLGKADEYFYTYLTPNVIIASCSAFLMIKSLDSYLAMRLRGTGVIMFLEKLSGATYGIYLVHVIWLELFAHGFFGFRLSGLVFSPVLSIPLTALVVFFISFVSVFVMKKIPLLKWIVP